MNAIRLELGNRPTALQSYLVQTIPLVMTLIFICYKTGERPRWRWGGDCTHERKES